MGQPQISLVLLWVLHLCGKEAIAGSVRIDESHKNLTNVPIDIPENVTTLDLSHNEIMEITNFPVLGKLSNLELNNNILSVFPAVCAVNSTLKYLKLQSNKISFIEADLLNCLSVLRLLNLYGNELSYIPQVGGLAENLNYLSISANKFVELPRFDILAPNLNSLGLSGNRGRVNADQIFETLSRITHEIITKLYLSHNNLNMSNLDRGVFTRFENIQIAYFDGNLFTEIPDFKFCKNNIKFLSFSYNPIIYLNRNDLKQYRKLEIFNCISCKLTSVPNTCTINSIATLTMNLKGNPFICDYRSKWLIPTRDAGAVTFSDFPCNEPSELSNARLEDLKMVDFKTYPKEKIISTRSDLFNLPNFRCASVIQNNDVISGISQIDCVTFCMRMDDCLVIGYHGNNQTCALYGPGVGERFDKGLNWFTIE